MPSRTDSFGIVFLEAWANGLPVVAADAGGVPEVVRHEETGLLVPFGDLDRLSQSIAGLLADPARARQLGEAGRKLVDHGYTWDDRYATLRGEPSRRSPIPDKVRSWLVQSPGRVSRPKTMRSKRSVDQNVLAIKIDGQLPHDSAQTLNQVVRTFFQSDLDFQPFAEQC